MNHEPEVIRARFVEAAFTERFLATAMAPSARGYWPEFFYDDEDRKGWDDSARLDNAAKWKGRASTGAISRHQECLDWTAELIHDEKRRHIVWAWAFCKANGWDFGANCIRRGWARPTAYRRLTSTIDAISEHFGIGGLVVRLPDDRWLRHEQPIQAIHSIQSRRGDDTIPAIPHKPFRTEKHIDLIRTDEDAESFAKFLQRRNELEAKRRARLGLDAE